MVVSGSVLVDVEEELDVVTGSTAVVVGSSDVEVLAGAEVVVDGAAVVATSMVRVVVVVEPSLVVEVAVDDDGATSDVAVVATPVDPVVDVEPDLEGFAQDAGIAIIASTAARAMEPGTRWLMVVFMAFSS